MAKRTTHVEPHYFEYIQNDRVAQREARLLAEQAWAESPNVGTASPDFENGYHEGFADYLYRGGSGEPPIIPPRGYWHLRFQNHFGKTKTNDWYEGFRAGVADCKARGLRDMWLIPTSLIADPEPPSAAATWTDDETWNRETYQRRVEERNQENQTELESLGDPDEPPTPDIDGDPTAPSELMPSRDDQSDSDDLRFNADASSDESDDALDAEPFVLQPEVEESDSELKMRDDEPTGDSLDSLFGTDPLPETEPLNDALDIPMDDELPSGDLFPGEGSGEGSDGFGSDDLQSRMIQFKDLRSAQASPRTSSQRIRRDTAVQQTSGTDRPSQVKPGNKLRTRRSNQSTSQVSRPQSAVQPRPYPYQAARSNQQTTEQPVAIRSSPPPSVPTQRVPKAPAIEITAADLLFEDSEVPAAAKQTIAPKSPPPEFAIEKVPTLPLQVDKPRPTDFLQWDPMEGLENKPAFEELDAKFKTVMSDEVIEQSTQWTPEMSRATELPLRVADMRMQTIDRPTFSGQSSAKEKSSGGLMDQLRMALKSSSKTPRSQPTDNQIKIRDYDRNVIQAEPKQLPPIVDLPDVINRGALPQTRTDSASAIQLRIRDK